MKIDARNLAFVLLVISGVALTTLVGRHVVDSAYKSRVEPKTTASVSDESGVILEGVGLDDSGTIVDCPPMCLQKGMETNSEAIDRQPKHANERSTDHGSYTILKEDSFIEDYGEHPTIVFKRHPEIVNALKQLDRAFSYSDAGGNADMGVSFGNAVVAFSDGRKMLLLDGCFPHNCSATLKMALYEPLSKKAYLATYVVKEGANKGISFLGDLDPLVSKFLYENYDPVSDFDPGR